MSAQQPFFIFGNPRSGTSLFRLMLNNHPKVVVPPECGFVEWLFEKFRNKEFDESTCRDFCFEVSKAKKFETWGVSYESLLSAINKRQPKTYQELVKETYLAYARNAGKDINVFGDKNNYYINHVEKIDAIFPKCKKVFIVRDGRDVACSYLDLVNKKIESLYKPNLSNNVVEIAREWQESVETMSRWLEKGALCIRYEDLVVDPAATLTKACDFLALDFSSEMLDYYKNNDEPSEFKAWKGKTFEPVEKSGLERFKVDLTEGQIRDFEYLAGGALKFSGYTLHCK